MTYLFKIWTACFHWMFMLLTRAGRYYLISISRLIEALNSITINEWLFSAILEQISGHTNSHRHVILQYSNLTSSCPMSSAQNPKCTQTMETVVFLAKRSSGRLLLVSSMLVARPSLLAEVNADCMEGAQSCDLHRENNKK